MTVSLEKPEENDIFCRNNWSTSVFQMMQVDHYLPELWKPSSLAWCLERCLMSAIITHAAPPQTHKSNNIYLPPAASPSALHTVGTMIPQGDFCSHILHTHHVLHVQRNMNECPLAHTHTRTQENSCMHACMKTFTRWLRTLTYYSHTRILFLILILLLKLILFKKYCCCLFRNCVLLALNFLLWHEHSVLSWIYENILKNVALIHPLTCAET